MGDIIHRLEGREREELLEAELNVARRAVADAQDAAEVLAKQVNSLRQHSWVGTTGFQLLGKKGVLRQNERRWRQS